MLGGLRRANAHRRQQQPILAEAQNPSSHHGH
jgi:hypothetical protein